MKDNYAFRSSTFMRALLVLLFMAVSIQWGFAQLNLNVSRGTLGTVIEQIKSQSKYQFFYDDKLAPMQRCLVPTGLYIALPEGFEAQVRPRSGLAIKKGITVLNSPGTIDADYRGEVCIILVNLSAETFVIEDGERIAQMVIARHEQALWQEVEVLDETERGAGGFGHTGKK